MAAGARRLIVKSLWSKSAMRLRVAEVSKVADIDSAHMLLRVERGKEASTATPCSRPIC